MSTRLARAAAVAAAAALAPLAASSSVCEAAPVVFPIDQGGNGNAYEVVVDRGASFDAVRSAAGAGRGHLLTITSAAEQAFVESLLAAADAPTGSYWMDLRRSGAGDDFTWGTGESFTFSNFAPGETNDFAGKEDLGQLYWSKDSVDDLADRRGSWNDAPNDGYPNPDNPWFPTLDLSRAGFIVERDAAAAVPLPGAVFAAPLTALLAVGAMRRMRRARAK